MDAYEIVCEAIGRHAADDLIGELDRAGFEIAPRSDLLDVAVDHIANDDYNHIPEATLRDRLAAIRQTRAETRLEEAADVFISEVRYALSDWDPTDPEYGPDEPIAAPQPMDGIGMGVVARSLGIGG